MSIAGIHLEGKVVEMRDGEQVVCTGGNGCNPDAIGTKVFGYFLKQGPGASTCYRRGDVKKVIGDAPVLPKKESTPQIDKPKMEKGGVVEQVTPQNFTADVTLWSDMERFSNGSMHMGYQLATYGDGKEGGDITAGGNEITVTVKGRTWGISLEVLVKLAQAADAQREAKLAQ